MKLLALKQKTVALLYRALGQQEAYWYTVEDYLGYLMAVDKMTIAQRPYAGKLLSYSLVDGKSSAENIPKAIKDMMLKIPRDSEEETRTLLAICDGTVISDQDYAQEDAAKEESQVTWLTGPVAFTDMPRAAEPGLWKEVHELIGYSISMGDGMTCVTSRLSIPLKSFGK